MGLNLDSPGLEMRDDPNAQMPRGTIIRLDADEDFSSNMLTTNVNKVVSWARRNRWEHSASLLFNPSDEALSSVL